MSLPADLIWECTKNFNAFQVKRRSGGGALFTRDPMNLINKETRKHSGFLNDQAVGLQHDGDNIKLVVKKNDRSNKPGQQLRTSKFSSGASSRKIYRSAVERTAKKDYRTDLRGDMIARASALKSAQRPKKDSPEMKPRGAKARRAAATEE